MESPEPPPDRPRRPALRPLDPTADSQPPGWDDPAFGAYRDGPCSTADEFHEPDPDPPPPVPGA